MKSDKTERWEGENVFQCVFFFSSFGSFSSRREEACVPDWSINGTHGNVEQFRVQFILLNEVVIQIVKSEEKQRVDTDDGFIKWNSISSVNTIEYGIEYVDIRPCWP